MVQFQLKSIFVVTLLAATFLCAFRFWHTDAPQTSPAGYNRAMNWPTVAINKSVDDLLVFRHHPGTDSGVEVERVTNGRIKWVIFANRFGVMEHSQYDHSASISINGNSFQIDSHGSAGDFREIRQLHDGSLISRQLK